MLLEDEARTYCGLVARPDSLTRTEFIDAVLEALLAVVASAIVIPRQTIQDNSADAEAISHEDWRAVEQRIARTLGELNDYWTGEPSEGDDLTGTLYNLPLSDDLADIWRDLSQGLRLRDANGSEADVLWHWKFTFENHWGRHASEALRVLLQLRLETP